MSKTYLIRSLLLLFALAPLTGCMTGPNEGDFIGSHYELVDAGGFTLNPNERIEVQAKHPTLGWITIGNFKTKSYSHSGFGYDWYQWGGKVQVPSWAWSKPYPSAWIAKAKVRAFGNQTSCVLMNFKSDWVSHWNPYGGDKELNELVTEAGHAAPVTLRAWAY